MKVSIFSLKQCQIESDSRHFLVPVGGYSDILRKECAQIREKLGLFCKKRCKSKVKVSIFSLKQCQIESDSRHFLVPVGGYSDILRKECAQIREKLGLFCKKRCKSKVKVSIFSLKQCQIESDSRHFLVPVGGYSDILRKECAQIREKLGLFCKKRCKSKVKVSIFSLKQCQIETDSRHFLVPVGGYSDILRKECAQIREKLGLFCKKRCKSKVKVSIFSLKQCQIESDSRHFLVPVGGYSDILRKECAQIREKLGLFCKKRCKSKVKVSIFSLKQCQIESDSRHFLVPVGGYSDILRKECAQIREKLGLFCKKRCKSKVKVSIFSLKQCQIESDSRHFLVPVGGYSDILRKECAQIREKLGLFCKKRCKSKVKVSIFSLKQCQIESDSRHFLVPVGGYSDILRKECAQIREKLGLFCKKRCKSKVKVSIFSLKQCQIESDSRHFLVPVGGYSDILRKECAQIREKLGLFCKKRCKSKVKVSIFSLKQCQIESDSRHFLVPVGGYSDILRKECAQIREKLGLFCKKRCKSKVKVSIFSLKQCQIESDSRHFLVPVGGYSDILRKECAQIREKLGLFCKKRCKSKVKVSIFSLKQCQIESDSRHFLVPVGGYSDILRKECAQIREKLGLFCKKRCKSKVKVSIFSLKQCQIETDSRHFLVPVGGYSDILRKECAQIREKLGLFCKKRCKSKVKVSIFSLKQCQIESDSRHFLVPVGGYSDILRKECAQIREKLGLFCKKRCKSKVKVSIFSLKQCQIESDSRHFLVPVGGYSDILRKECAQIREKLGLFCKKRCKSKVKVSIFSLKQCQIETDSRHFLVPVGGYSDILRKECAQIREKLGLFCKKRCKSKVKVSIFSLKQCQIESDSRHFLVPVGGYSDILRKECAQIREKLGLFCKKRCKSKVKVSIFSLKQCQIESDSRHFLVPVGGYSDILRKECAQIREKLGLFCKKRCKSKVKVSIFSLKQCQIESDSRHFLVPVGGYSDILRKECAQIREKLGLFCKKRCKSKVKVSIFSLKQCQIESDSRHFLVPVGGYSDILRKECAQIREKLGLFCKKRCKSKVKVSIFSLKQCQIESDSRHFLVPVGGYSDILRKECAQIREKLGLFCKKRCKSKVKVSIFSLKQCQIESDSRHFLVPVGGYSDILRKECAQIREKLGLFCKKRCKSKVKVSIFSLKQCQIESDSRHFLVPVGGYSDILRKECAQIREKLGLFCKKRCKSKVKVSIFSLKQCQIESDSRHFLVPVGGYSDILRKECAQIREKLGLFCKKRCKSKVKVSIFSLKQCQIESDSRHFLVPVGGYSDILRKECAQIREKLGLFCKKRCKSKVKVSIFSLKQCQIESDSRHFLVPVGGYSDILRKECAQIREKLGLFCKKRCKSKVKVSIFSLKQCQIESDSRHFLVPVGGYSDILRKECAQIREKLGLFCKKRCKSKVKVSIFSLKQCQIESDSRHFLVPVGGYSDILRKECAQIREKLGLFCKKRCKSKVKVSIFSLKQCQIESDSRHFLVPVGGYSDILRKECAQIREKLGLFCKKRCKSKVKVSIFSLKQCQIESDSRHFLVPVGGYSDILRKECAQIREKLGLFCKKRCKSKVKVSIFSLKQCQIESDSRHFLVPVGGYSDILRKECAQIREKLGLFCKKRCKSKVKVSIFSLKQCQIESDSRHFLVPVGGYSDILRKECAQIREKLGLFCKKRCKSKVKVSIFSLKQCQIETDSRHFLVPVGGYSDILRKECAQIREKLGLFCKKRCKSKVKVSIFSLKQCQIESDSRHFLVPVGGYSDILRKECAQIREKLGLFCKKRCKSKVKVSIFSLKQCQIESDSRHFLVPVGGYSDILRKECAQIREKLGLFCKKRCKSKVKVSIFSLKQCQIETDSRHFLVPVGGYSDILRKECAQIREKLGLFCKKRCKSKVKVSIFSLKQCQIESDSRHFLVPVGGYSDILRKECAQIREKLGLFCKKRCKSKVKVSIFSLKQCQIETDSRHFLVPVGGYSDILRKECAQIRRN